MKRTVLLMLAASAFISAFGQQNVEVRKNAPLIFTNYGEPVAFGIDTFYSSKIHEITLNPNKTFEFWSRPHISCFTWHQYKGTWKEEKDTLFFSDRYDVDENDVRVTYQKDSKPSFNIRLKTDKNAALRNRTITVRYIYDFDANIEDSEKVFNLQKDNAIIIPFKDISNLELLAAIKIEYQLNSKEKRSGYLTENNPLNIKKKSIPNVINVEFVEYPQKETVYRTIKGVIKKDTLLIVSTTKTRTVLPDYNDGIEFEASYALTK